MKVTFKIPSFIKPALYNDYKYSIIAAGRRVGKTYNAIQWLLEMMLTDQNARAGIHVDTTQSNLTAYVERYYKPILKDVWHMCNWNGQRYVLTLPGGKYIDFRSSQKPENMEGFEYQYAILNEAGIILNKANLWNETLEPMLQKAKVKIIGTPRGKNLFHKLYQKGVVDKNLYASFKFASSDSPFITKEAIQAAKENLPHDIYIQNYLAEFVDGAGSVFRNISGCIREPIDCTVDVIGIDLAKRSDFTVFCAMDSEKKQVVEMDRFNQIDWSFQKTRIVEFWQKHGQPLLVIDSTGVGDPIVDDLLNAGVNVEPYRFTNASKSQLIKGLSIALDQGVIGYPNIDYLIAELEVFGYDVTPSGNLRYNAPEGFHDDAVIALALAYNKANTYQDIEMTWV